MSKNRKNIIWQSPDGTWNRAFYDFYEVPASDGEEWDPEWDVEYTSDFNWVSTGHATEEDAHASWRGANPGGYSRLHFRPDTAEQIAELDDLAAQAFERGETTFGPRKQRVPRLLAEQLNNARVTAHRHKIEGNANQPDPRIPEWEQQLDDLMRTATAMERTEARAAIRGGAESLTRIISDPTTVRRVRISQATATQINLALEDIAKWRAWRGPKSATPAGAPTAKPQRAKTTPKSTSGSYAPHHRSDPEGSL